MHTKVMAQIRKFWTDATTNAQIPNSHCGDYIMLTVSGLNNKTSVILPLVFVDVDRQMIVAANHWNS